MLKKLIPSLVLVFSLIGWSMTAFAAKSDALSKAKDAAAHSEWEQVLELAQQATGEEPNNEEAWALLADAQMVNGDTATAVANYEKALQIDQKLPSAVLALTSYYVKADLLTDAERVVAAAEEKDKKGKIDEIKVARGQIYAARGDMGEATKILASASAKNPKNPLYPQILARIYENKRVLDLAEKYYADAWKLAPGDPILAYEYALVLQDQKKYNDALELFKEVQEKDPKNKSVDYMIGRLYYAAHRYAEAATQFEKAVEKRPEHFLSNYLLGKSYYDFSREEKKNFYSLSEKWLRKTLALKPDRQDVRKLLAEVLATEGKLYYQRAAADTFGAKGALRDVFESLAERSWSKSAVPADKDEQYKTAYRKAKIQDSLDTVTKLLNKVALLDSAIMFSQNALQYDTASTGVYSQIARAWDRLGHLDSAIYYCEMQLARTPEDQIEFARLVNLKQRKKDQQSLVDLLKPFYDRLDWVTPKAAGDAGDAGDILNGPQDKFIDKFAGIYANALIETGKSAQARDVLRVMLKYKPAWCDGHSLNAYIDLKREDYTAAIPVLQAGVRSCPGDKDLWTSLGDSWYFANPKKKENIQNAKDAYQRACSLGSRDACDKYQQLNQ
ncbi:hypothetical protein EHM69_01455 [candidate division KSB1 bacterium]|nr:MAG: hypothetical protein EHM69_01455 [candidate division KSB1 bacterium]